MPFKAPTEKLNAKSKKMVPKSSSPLLCAVMLYSIGTVPETNTEFTVPAIYNKGREKVDRAIQFVEKKRH